MKREYMLKRLVPLYNNLGVEVSLNIHGVVRLRHSSIPDDCYYSSLTNLYDMTFGSKSDPEPMSSCFFVLNSDGSTVPPIPL